MDVYTTGKEPWNPALVPVIESISEYLPEEFKKCVAPGFYVTFWQLALYDIYVPENRYKIEIDKMKISLAKLDAELAVESTGAVKKRRERERVSQSLATLEKELQSQTENFGRVATRLLQEKSSWFSENSTRSEIVNAVVQNCLHPRCVFSAQDAIFCSKFVFKLHEIGTEQWASLILFDKVCF